MTIKHWLETSRKTLENVNIGTARLDTELLLSDALGKDRSWILAHQDEELPSGPSLQALDEQVKRRAQHEPIAYIRGKQEFYGRDFQVSPDTLTPRPETETLVELALELLRKEKIQSIADIGTGSGCIIITLELETDVDAIFTGYEISKPALKIARNNAKNLGATVDFVEIDITKDDGQAWLHAELVAANLPYVPTDFNINLAASHEPEFAIFGGKDGLDYYRELFSKLTKQTKYVITESLPPQHKELRQIATKAGFILKKTQDFIQVFTRK